nr:neuronal acetylcholine receptor subunit beta-3-like [Biomphalaria glabrata]
MINIVLPVIFLSFLNILVFLIPADSGEKIGYGITVLLALSVFLSIVGGMLPRSSKSMPEVTMYLFILLIISMLTVLDSIAIVCLHHMEEKETKHLRAKHNYKSAIKKVTTLRQAVTGLNGVSKVGLSTIAAKLREQGNAKTIHVPESPDKGNNHENDSLDEDQKSYAEYNKYKIIGKYIDKVSLVVFLVVWLAVTAGFMLDIASPHIF